MHFTHIFSRYSLPAAQVKSSHQQDRIAEKLFGNHSNQNATKISDDPLVLISKDNINQKSFGIEIDGFTIRFSNKTFNVQTDVGVCVATDPLNHLEDKRIVKRSSSSQISNGIRNVEHLMVISVSKIGRLDNFKVINQDAILSTFKL